MNETSFESIVRFKSNAKTESKQRNQVNEEEVKRTKEKLEKIIIIENKINRTEEIINVGDDCTKQ